MNKSIEENKSVVVIKIFLWEFDLYCKFICGDESYDKNKRNLTPLPPPPFTPSTVFLIAEK